MPPKGKKEAPKEAKAKAEPKAEAKAKKAEPKAEAAPKAEPKQEAKPKKEAKQEAPKAAEAAPAPAAAAAKAEAKPAQATDAKAEAPKADGAAPAKKSKTAARKEKEAKKKAASKPDAAQANALKDKGNQCYQRGNWREAIEFYTQAIAGDLPDLLPSLYSNRSVSYLGAKNPAAALADADKVIELKSDWAKGYFRRGQALEELLRYPEAQGAYAKGAALDADDSVLKNALTEVEALLKQLSFGPEVKEGNPDNDRFEDMCQWLRDGGAKFPKLYLRYYSEDYRGVHTLTRIPADDEVLYVPLKYIMTSEIAKESDIGKKIIASGVDLRSKHSYLAAYLLQEKHKKEKSFWSPYMRILPQKYANMPLYFDEELLGWLQGSMTLQKIADRIDSLRREYDQIRRSVPEFGKYTLDEFIWARLVVITRIFGLVVQGNKTDGLVPYADMLNHKKPRESLTATDECETKWTFEDSKNGFIITTVKSIGRGEQIFDSYGRKCNSRFFVNYGFTLLDNVEDNEAMIRVYLPASDPHYQMKIRMLGGSDHKARREFQVPAGYNQKKVKELFSFMRFVHARDSELMQVSSGEGGGKLDELEPLSLANERKVLADIKHAAEVSLAAFTDTLEQDEKLLETEYTEWGNKRNCIIMRRGEKQVLRWLVKLSEVALPLMSMTWKDLKRTAAKYSGTGEFDHYVTAVVVTLVKKGT